MFHVAQQTAAYGPRGQDRVAVIEHPSGIVVALADGAGGTSGGAEAADTLLLWVRAYVTRAADLREAAQWGALLERVDQQIAAGSGQTTVVVVALWDGGLAGASVGDSAAWRIDDGDVDRYDDLTAGQVRKPLLGSAAAKPVTFERTGSGGTLLVASDGLVKYAPPGRICDVARQRDLHEAARRLIELVRLKSGALQDDVGVALVRRITQTGATAAPPSRRRYTLTADGEMTEHEAE